MNDHGKGAPGDKPPTRGYDSRPDTYEHIGQVRGLLLGLTYDLLNRAHSHDASKLVEPELSMFDEFTPKLRDSTYGSEEYEGFRESMGEALRHHYAENRHHPEHFDNGIEGMTLIDLIEMLCDWLAATRRHDDGDIHRSIEQNQERFGYGDEIKRLLHQTVTALEFLELARYPQAAEPHEFPLAAQPMTGSSPTPSGAMEQRAMRFEIQVDVEPGHVDATYLRDGFPITGHGDSTGTLSLDALVGPCLRQMLKAAAARREAVDGS